MKALGWSCPIGMKIVVLGGAGVTKEWGVRDGAALPQLYYVRRGKKDALQGYNAAVELAASFFVPTLPEPRPRLAVAELVERLSRAAPRGVSCFTLNIDGLWPQACAVHGSIPERNVVLVGVVPARVEKVRVRRYAKLAAALRAADRILICGMSGRTDSINDVLKSNAAACRIWWVDPDHTRVGLPLPTSNRLRITKVTGTVRDFLTNPPDEWAALLGYDWVARAPAVVVGTATGRARGRSRRAQGRADDDEAAS
jgi:NAD-dependent SIR2 family protein deacetylase